MPEDYEFPGLPLAPVQPGTTVLLAGPAHAGTRRAGLRMVAGARGDGAIVITTNRRARRILDDCRRAGLEPSGDDVAVLDCVGDGDGDLPARVLPVSGPSDLTGIGMRFADVYRDLGPDRSRRVRTGLFSLSTLLSFNEFPTVTRFVHTLVGRVEAVDGLGVLVVDPTSHDDRVVNTLSQFCAGRIDVRETDAGPELRARGLPDQGRAWAPLDGANEER